MDHLKNRKTAMFQWVQQTPVGHLKALTDERLQDVRETLIKEVREVGRALHWVEGIIKLKAIEKSKEQGNAEERS